uniref:C2 domain-containing protein n=1 Tax=Parastrongyloides trichosuri TaxID=131310 RepID=A0A0N4ZPV7_PARTI
MYGGIPNPMLIPPYNNQIINQQTTVEEITGRIEISLSYLPLEKQLIVTIHRALDLSPRGTGACRNPYVKLFLLPDRSEKSRRQTAVLSESIVPVWNESFYYQNITENMLFGEQKRVLEVTVWDYDKYDANMFLGEVLIDFNNVPLNNEICIYNLTDMDDEHPIRIYLRHNKNLYNTTNKSQQPSRPHSEMSQYPHVGGTRYHNYESTGSPFYDFATGTMDMNKRSRNPLPIPGRIGNISRSRTYDRSTFNNPIERGKRSLGNYYNDDIQDQEYPVPDYDHSSPAGDRNNGYLSDTGALPYSRRRNIPPQDSTFTGNKSQQQYYDNRHNINKRPQSAVPYRNLPHSDEGGISQGGQPPIIPLHGNINDLQGYYNESGNYQYQGSQDQTVQYYGNDNYNGDRKNGFPYDPRTQTGRLRYEASMMGEGGGYGSDNSESISINSVQSIPNNTTTTVIRRTNHGVEEYDTGGGITVIRHEPIEEGDYGMMNKDEDINNRSSSRRRDGKNSSNMSSGNGVLGSGQQQGNKIEQQQMKDRKKSIMTRLIPGRSQPNDCPKRTGFARSEEVGVPDSLAVNGSGDRLQAPFLKQASKDSTDSSHSENFLPLLPDGPLGHFIENLGPGQVVGRQVLASPVLGEINIGISLPINRSGLGQGIDIEIIRAKNLVTKPGSKTSPSPYVKVYLLEGKNCIAKAKTSISNRKTTNPVFQQHLMFNENAKKKMIQITVLGDYGRMERKSFMGIALIRLDDLDLENRATRGQQIVGWYKLFHNSSLAGTGPIRKDSENSLMG